MYRETVPLSVCLHYVLPACPGRQYNTYTQPVGQCRSIRDILQEVVPDRSLVLPVGNYDRWITIRSIRVYFGIQLVEEFDDFEAFMLRGTV